MEFESIIFDVDGTLWDSRALLAEAYNNQLQAEGITDLHVTAELLTPLFGRTMTALADGLFEGYVPAPERYALMDRCIIRMDRHMQAFAGPHMGYPHLRSTLEQLKKRHRLFIVSNGQKGYPQMAANKLGLADLMDGYLSFGDTGKPKGQTILQLMQQHNIQNAVYVGDTQGDLEACQEAGIPFIFTSFGFGQPEQWYAKVDCFSQLSEVLSYGNSDE